MLVSIVLTTALALAVSALPQPAQVCQPQCCASIKPASDPAASQLLGLLGIVLQGVNVPIGLGPCTSSLSRVLCVHANVSRHQWALLFVSIKPADVLHK